MLNLYNKHAGQTALLVGNAPNLTLTPPEWFRYPSFGMNTCHLWEGTWKPDYYCAVDQRVMREFGKAITGKYADTPKFIPRPNLDAWQGENFYRFYHRPGPLLVGSPKRAELLDDGLCFGNVMQVAAQIAAWMGFTTLLMIGVQHDTGRAQAHFWGWDDGMHAPPVGQWLGEYRQITGHFAAHGIRTLNISADTHVPADCLPRGDWRDWRNDESQND